MGAAALVQLGRAAGVPSVERARPMIVAHRAGAALGPENTLEALEQSIAAGADMAEVDVRLTRDGVPVLLHDSTLLRTTGVNEAVSQTSLEQVRKLDAGSWFDPDFAGEGVPTLEEALSTAQGRIPLMLELKSGGGEGRLVQAVVELVRSMKMEKECQLASSSTGILRLCGDFAPEIERILIASDVVPGLEAPVSVQGYSVDLRRTGAAAGLLAHRENRDLYIWTANSYSQLRRALALGPDGLITDDPLLARALLEGKAGEEKS